MFWCLLWVVLFILVMSLLGLIVAKVEPLWRFWTWLVGTIFTHGQIFLIVGVLLIWLEWSDRAGRIIAALTETLKR